MKCKTCGYEGETFSCTPMGKYCCPQCGAGNEEMVGQPVNQSVADYAAMLEKLAMDASETAPENTEEFVRLDAWGKKNAAFLNHFPADTIATILNFDRHYLRKEGWPDELWEHSVKQWVLAGRGRTEASPFPVTYESHNLLGFEILYAAGGVVEFRRKLRKGLWNDADGKWHTYYAPSRFIDGDVRPLFDGQRMKLSGLFKTEKVYRFKG